MQLTLTPTEARILGALIEKEITTPEYYPLSLNALTNACNQKSNRDPAMELQEDEIRKALVDLEKQSLVRPIAESRATKYQHRLQDAFNFYRPEIAIIAELLLRGPQTPGELRTRASRMHLFEDLESVHFALQRLAKREPPLVTVLPRQPGTKEARYAHLLGDTPPTDTPVSDPTCAQDTPRQGRHGDTRMAATTGDRDARGSADRVAELTKEVTELRKDVADIKSQFAAFRKQFE